MGSVCLKLSDTEVAPRVLIRKLFEHASGPKGIALAPPVSEDDYKNVVKDKSLIPSCRIGGRGNVLRVTYEDEPRSELWGSCVAKHLHKLLRTEEIRQDGLVVKGVGRRGSVCDPKDKQEYEIWSGHWVGSVIKEFLGRTIDE